MLDVWSQKQIKRRKSNFENWWQNLYLPSCCAGSDIHKFQPITHNFSDIPNFPPDLTDVSSVWGLGGPEAGEAAAPGGAGGQNGDGTNEWAPLTRSTVTEISFRRSWREPCPFKSVLSCLQTLAVQEKLSEQEKANVQLQAERREREVELKQEVGPNLHHFSLGSIT